MDLNRDTWMPLAMQRPNGDEGGFIAGMECTTLACCLEIQNEGAVISTGPRYFMPDELESPFLNFSQSGCSERMSAGHEK